jgi:hypothetical protein
MNITLGHAGRVPNENRKIFMISLGTQRAPWLGALWPLFRYLPNRCLPTDNLLLLLLLLLLLKDSKLPVSRLLEQHC